MQIFKNKLKKNFGNIVIEKVSHPSSPWWNRSGGVHGRVKFENLLREHWVNKNSMNEIVFQKLNTIHNSLLSQFQKEIYKQSNCVIWKGNYLSCLYLQVKDKTFCCETGIKINDVDFWTCFYKTENSKEIPSLEEKKYQFKPTHSDDEIISKIEKIINQIFEEVG